MELDLFAFAAWLRSQPDSMSVGVVSDSDYGPLALWLEAITGQRWVVSWPAESYRLYETLDWRPLPLWAGLFHHWIAGYREDYEDISKRLALSVLRR